MTTHPPQTLILRLLLFTSTILIVAGDVFDSVVSAKVSKLSIRGAAITYYDKNKMTTPLTRGYGQVSSDDSAASVTPDTVFMLASVSKPFAASAVVVLVKKGLISSIDDDICDVVPSEYSDDICRNPKQKKQKSDLENDDHASVLNQRQYSICQESIW